MIMKQLKSTLRKNQICNQGRIEPSSDPEVDKYLFTKYAALIKPFKHMKDDLSRIEFIKRKNAELAMMSWL